MTERDDASQRGRLPDFLVIGAPRSGTTALTTYLRARGDVFIPANKELNFFDRDDPSPAAIDRYRRQFRAARAAQVVGEATPTYLSSAHAPARMAHVVPDARLVALVRDPVDRAYSHYWLGRALRFESRPFVDAVREEIAGDVRPGLDYLACGRYLEQIERVLEHYPRAALLVEPFDGLREAPGELFGRVCAHVGIPGEPVPAVVGRRINSATRPRSIALWRFLERWRTRGRRGVAIAGFVSMKNCAAFVPPPMDPAARTLLSDYFAEPNAALAQWLENDAAQTRARMTARQGPTTPSRSERL